MGLVTKCYVLFWPATERLPGDVMPVIFLNMPTQQDDLLGYCEVKQFSNAFAAREFIRQFTSERAAVRGAA